MLEVVPESQRELLRSRNTDIRAIQVASASLDGSEWISASSEPFFEWLDALESTRLPLDDYAGVVCPEMSGKLAVGRYVRRNVPKCPEMSGNPSRTLRSAESLEK